MNFFRSLRLISVTVTLVLKPQFFYINIFCFATYFTMMSGLIDIIQ